MTTAEIFFMLIFAGGLTFLVFSFIFGELGELFGEPGFGDADTSSSSSLDVPEWYDLKVIAAGLVGLGATGFIALQLSWPNALAAAVSLIGFVVVAGIAFFGILKPLSKQQYNALLSRHSYTGMSATVLVTVLPDSFGVVEIIDANGSRVSEKAYTDTKVLPAGSVVLVYEVGSDGVHVTEDPNNPVELQ